MNDISLVPNSVFNIGNLPIHSSILATIIVTGVIALLGFYTKKNIKLVPGRGIYAIESLVGFFYDKASEITNDKKYSIYYTNIVLSFFIFIFIANQFSLIPLVQSIIVNEGSLFKTPTAHFSQTITLAIVTVLLSHVMAFYISPMKHLDNMFNIKSLKEVKSLKDIPNLLLDIFLALLNLIGEFSKIISLAARLFGNIFAGEVMVAIIAGLSVYTAFIVPIPFIVLSIFSGVIQTFVFAFLAFSFITDNVENVR